jgi:hypothetical protein
MKLRSIFSALALCTVLLGCGGNKPETASRKTDPAKAGPAKESTSGSSEPEGVPKESSSATTEPAQPKEIAKVPGPPEAPKHAGEEVRRIAARLIEKNPQGAWRINPAAALELEKLGGQGQTDLVALLGDDKPEVRRGAAYYLLANFSPDDEKLVAGYADLLDDPEPFLRSLGLQAVRKMHKADQLAAIPRLAKMLSAKQEPSDDNRASLARLLGSLKQDGNEALDSLTAGAKEDGSPKVRGAYLVAISQIAAPAEALPAFRQGLADQDAAVRLVAAARLRQLAKEAAPAAEELAHAMEDADPRVRDSAAEALAQVGPAAVKPLIKQVDSKNATTRKLAIACLGIIGSPAKEALPYVERHLTDEDPEVKTIAEVVARKLKGS